MTTDVMLTGSQGAKAPTTPELFWLYGVIQAGRPSPSVPSVALVEVRHHALTALVEPVPSAEFSPEVLEARLQSIEWVAPLAKRHNEVLKAAMRGGAVIPARLCTLFSTRDAVAASLSARERTLVAALERVDGACEWGLRVTCDMARLEAALLAAQVAPLESAGLSPGLAYINARKREARARELAEGRVDEVIDELLESLAHGSVESRERPVRGALAGEQGASEVLHVAALVRVDDEDALREAVEAIAARYAEDGFRFELSGPWAPFSFCDDDARGDSEEATR